MKTLDMEIIEAIEAMNMRHVVEHAEEERRRRTLGRGASWIGVLAVAACMAIGIINVGNTKHMLRSSAEEQLGMFELQSVKGSDEVFDMLILAARNIHDKKYDQASAILDEAEKKNVLPDNATEQQISIVNSCAEDIEWLRAIICMRQGKVRDSKQALLKISKEKGFYHTNAELILTNVYDK